MAARLRTVFFGSSDFSVPPLRRLLNDQEVVAVVSQPARPAGRGLQLTATPAAELARKANVELLTPKLLDDAFVEKIRSYRPRLIAVASYGKILPAALLSIEGATALNVHPSLLPAYRGATPIQAALRDGCNKTGVTVFWMSAGMDDGDVALARSVVIEPADNFGSLHDKLAQSGADLLAEAARQLSERTLPRTPQRSEGVTYTKPLTKQDLRLRLDVPAKAAVNQVRSLSPKPSAWIFFDGKRLKILETVAIPEDVALRVYSRQTRRPGDLLGYSNDGPVIATSPGAICLTKVIPEGKPLMSGAEFAARTTQTR
jgi:methionyl-tRNA formyltransferase